MQLRTKNLRYSILIAALCLASCAELDAQEGSAGSGGDDIAATAEALGSWTSLYRSASGARSIAASSKYSIFVYSPEGGAGCHTNATKVDVILTQSGLAMNVPRLPGDDCSTNIRAAVGDANGIFVGDSKGKRIYALEQQSDGRWAWRRVASTPGTNISKMLSSSTHVYWKDKLGIHRVAKAGGAVATLLTSDSALTLLGLDGSYLYVNKAGGAADIPPHSLLKLPVTGQTPTTLRVSNDFWFGDGFRFDASFFYFIDNPGTWPDPSRVLRLTKSGSTLATLYTSSESHYVGTALNGTHLYWYAEEGSDTRVYRRHLSTGNLSSTTFPFHRYEALVVGPAYLYVIGGELDEPDREWLYRGAL